MPVIGAAAAPQHVELAMPREQIAILPAEFLRIAVIQIGRLVELGMAALGRVGAQAAQPFAPGRPCGQRRREMDRGWAQLIM